jgi:chromatin structure-remodeling complex subunit RSC4
VRDLSSLVSPSSRLTAFLSSGRSLSFDFYHLPSKRKYPDYYEIIKNPVALDQIKKRIDGGYYPNLRAVREELETCFRNAKRYNQPESQIFQDAKVLHVRDTAYAFHK